MTPREELEKRLRTWGIEPDSKILDNYRVKSGPVGILFAGCYEFYQDAELGRLQWEAMVDHARTRVRSTTFDGRRLKSESGALYSVSDPENAAEIKIQRGLAEYELPSFSFRDWPAREENGEIIVGTDIYEQRWPKHETKSNIEAFLRSVAIAEPFRARAAESSSESNESSSVVDDTSSVDTYGDLPTWNEDFNFGLGGERTEPDTALCGFKQGESTKTKSLTPLSKTEGQPKTS